MTANSGWAHISRIGGADAKPTHPTQGAGRPPWSHETRSVHHPESTGTTMVDVLGITTK